MWKYIAVVTSFFFLAIVGLAQANTCSEYPEQAQILGVVTGAMVEANGNCLAMVEFQNVWQHRECPVHRFNSLDSDGFSFPSEGGVCPQVGNMISFTALRNKEGYLVLEDLAF